MDTEPWIIIYVWGVDNRWHSVFSGERKDIPDQWRERVALIDASDVKRVAGVGTCGGDFYYYLYDFCTA